MAAITNIRFEATDVEIEPSCTRIMRIEVSVGVYINELLDAVGENTIWGYLEDDGFKVEEL